VLGRELRNGDEQFEANHVMLTPYAADGSLFRESRLGPLGRYLSQKGVKERLLKRTCVTRKPWYAFHENPPMTDVLRPKLMCKDITAKPHFWMDRTGQIIPRHSVYYIVPKRPEQLQALFDYLNGDEVSYWLNTHCQRAANGFLRLQSQVLKRIPVTSRSGLLDSSRIRSSKRQTLNSFVEPVAHG